jgi:3-methyladenine DNA glycosylase/8-oxoguanine DNA glycosylase
MTNTRLGTVMSMADERGRTQRVTPRGPFDLLASSAFLEGFTPASRPDAAAEPGVLRFAFPVERGWEHVGVLARQVPHAPGVTAGTVELTVHGPPEAVPAAHEQARRILSLDVDGSGFGEVGRRDEVVGELQARWRGLRPVLFHSPYEAACWAILSQRIRMTQAAALKDRIAERLGERIDVGGRTLGSFPAPERLRELAEMPGLPRQKVLRLHTLADAALDGRLDAAELRAMPAEQALAWLRRLPGIGPFSAQLVLVRGVGHPDVFPRAEARLHTEMCRAYRLTAAAPEDLEAVAEAWRPYRSWVALLLRVDRENRTGELGGRVPAARSRS